MINELKPDFKTIADFRKDNKKQIKLAFKKFSMICDELGLIGKEMVAVDVTSNPMDKEQFHRMALQAKEEMGVETITALADKGYYSAQEFAKCKEDNIIPIVSKADHSHMAATIEFGKSQFKYDEANDGLYAPKAIC